MQNHIVLVCCLRVIKPLTTQKTTVLDWKNLGALLDCKFLQIQPATAGKPLLTEELHDWNLYGAESGEPENLRTLPNK